jgi:hypothetical protein
VKAAALAGAGLGADVAFDPLHNHVPLCPFHAITGWWCPFCGGLRAVDQLGHGHVAAACHDNALLVALLPLVAIYWIDWIFRASQGHDRRPIGRNACLVSVTLLVTFTVLRNLPGLTALRR